MHTRIETVLNTAINGVRLPDAAARTITPDEVHATLGRHMLVDGFEFVLDLENSQGSWIVDSRTGKRYLDFFTFFASLPIGLNHPKLNTPEFLQKIGKIALQKPSCSDVYTVEMAQFVDTFFRLAVPDHFKYTFFIEGGALAIENALKAAFDWKVRKNQQQGLHGERGHLVAHFMHAFHGRSGYTLSLTNTDPVKTQNFPKFNDWPRILNPGARFPLEGDNLKQTIQSEQTALAQLEAAFQDNPNDIACVIIEPVQAEGGDIHFRREFLVELQRLCHKHDALLIFDEVQTGVGITGTMWLHQQLGVNPDIMAFGKKTQVCGILVGPRIDEVPDNVFRHSGRINSTWGGNLVDMVRFTKYLEIIAEEDMVGNAERVGARLLDGLLKLQEQFPALISNTRGRGLMCAIDFPSGEHRKQFRLACYDAGLIILGCGENTIRFRPPLNLSDEEADIGLQIIHGALHTMAS